MQAAYDRMQAADDRMQAADDHMQPAGFMQAALRRSVAPALGNQLNWQKVIGRAGNPGLFFQSRDFGIVKHKSQDPGISPGIGIAMKNG
jgi:hypothetical protein